MKKQVTLMAIILCAILLTSACTTRSPPPYRHIPVDDAYVFSGSTALSLTAAYPLFEDEIYAPLNEAIYTEVEAWRALYEQLYERVAEECEKDPVFSELERYVEADYTVEVTDKEITVIFFVKWFDGGNTEPSYTKTFTFELESRMVYETFTQTKRVY